MISCTSNFLADHRSMRIIEMTPIQRVQYGASEVGVFVMGRDTGDQHVLRCIMLPLSHIKPPPVLMACCLIVARE